MRFVEMFTGPEQQLTYVGIEVFNYLPKGWRKANRWDLLSKESRKLKINVDYLLESMFEPAIFFQFNTTRHPLFSLELKPWFEEGMVWVEDDQIIR